MGPFVKNGNKLTRRLDQDVQTYQIMLLLLALTDFKRKRERKNMILVSNYFL